MVAQFELFLGALPGPNASGRSREGELVRTIRSTPLQTNIRLSHGRASPSGQTGA
jgi:hypothetical protein